MPPNPLPEHPPVCYGYGRVSTTQQVEEGLSLEAQQHKIKAKWQADLQGAGIRWGDCFIDAGVSAFKKKLGERQAGAALLGRLKPGDHVIMTRLDRGFRRASDAIKTFDEWRAKGITVHLLDFGIDSSKPAGRMMLGLLAVFAEFERELAAERTALVMARRKKRVGHVNQYVGYGFRLVGPKGHKRVIPDTKEQAVMAAIVEMKDKGHEWREIWLSLLKQGIRTSRGKEWSQSRIIRVYKAVKAGQPNASAPPTSAGSA